ncbi:MAG: hypothetical protein NZM37_05065 [Sandaracinaceae bacterium]|nr:hypothetical protein [Sandaracinaceae bacterium]MDW8246422.1 hypothetical protein [Sandaracinaceae bacterium]
MRWCSTGLRKGLEQVAFLTFFVVGCGGGSKNYVLQGTQRDPGADARVQVEKLDGGNYLVTITATNLTPPNRIGTGNAVYLVWVRPPGGQAQMESQLAYQGDQRTGRATLTTPHRKFTLLVTAEREATVNQPSENVVLQQEIEM